MPNTAPDSGARVHVAVGVICDDRRRILVSRRPDHVHQGGLWEFPGGKVEAGESVAAALRRELLEELAIEVLACRPLTVVRHDYADKAVLLDVWWVSAFRGEPRSCEGQPWQWIAAVQLDTLSFPEANQPIIAAIQQQWR
jgi:8-oxo-dGTP diphosphatase